MRSDWWDDLNRESLAAARDRAREETLVAVEEAGMFMLAYGDALAVIDDLVRKLEALYYPETDQ